MKRLKEELQMWSLDRLALTYIEAWVDEDLKIKR